MVRNAVVRANAERQSMSIKMTKEQVEHTHRELVCMFNSLVAIDRFWSDRLFHFIEARNYIGILETTRDINKVSDGFHDDEPLLIAKMIELSELLESHYEPKEPTDKELEELEDDIGEQLKWENPDA